MADDRTRLEKVLAVAINPGAVEGEAFAALRRARELVKQNPALAHPPSPPASESHPHQPVTAIEATFTANITDVILTGHSSLQDFCRSKPMSWI